MGATFSRLKNWVAEKLTYADLNAEIDNVIDNLTPSGMDDYSTNVPQMQTTVSPGAAGSESLATSLAGELARIRFAIRRMLGTTYWYEDAGITISEVASRTSVPANRIVSGKVRSATYNQPIFLVPAGSSNAFTLAATDTDFVVRINDAELILTADIVTSGTSLAESTQNTALVNHSALSGQEESKYAGERDSQYPVITIDNVGTEISSRVGQYAAFSVGATEYFIAFIKSATELTEAYRGYFFNSSNSPVPRLAISNNDTITLLKIHWVFVKNDLTVTTTTNPPVYAKDQPTGPNTGDMWFDLANDTWKVYGGASYSALNGTLIGVVAANSTNVVAARSYDFYAPYDDTNEAQINVFDAATVRSMSTGVQVSVAGQLFRWGDRYIQWDMGTDLTDTDGDTGEDASKIYFFYLTDSGDEVISTVRPYERYNDLRGMYHPYAPWRCLGSAFNDGSSNLYDTAAGFAHSYNKLPRTQIARPIAPINVPAPIGNFARSLSSGAYQDLSGGPAYVNVTNLYVTITTTGRPVMIMLQPDGTADSSYIATFNAGNNYIRYLRNATALAYFAVNNNIIAGLGEHVALPANGFSFMDFPPAGTHTYYVQVSSGTSSGIAVQYTIAIAYEI